MGHLWEFERDGRELELELELERGLERELKLCVACFVCFPAALSDYFMNELMGG